MAKSRKDKSTINKQKNQTKHLDCLSKRVEEGIWLHFRLIGDVKAIRENVSTDEGTDVESNFRTKPSYSKNQDNGLLVQSLLRIEAILYSIEIELNLFIQQAQNQGKPLFLIQSFSLGFFFHSLSQHNFKDWIGTRDYFVSHIVVA